MTHFSKYFALLLLTFVFVGATKAQSWQVQSASMSHSVIDSCNTTTVTLNAYLGCINWQVNGISVTTTGSVINVNYDCTSSFICAGAISYPSDSVVLQNLAVGGYTVNANAILDNNLINTVSVGSLTVNPCVATALSESKLEQDFALYPNPTKGEINITSSSKMNESVQYEVIDITGSNVKSESIYLQNNNSLIDLTDLPKGIYFLRVQGETINFQQKVIII